MRQDMELWHFLPNAPQDGTAKGTAILGLQRFTRRHTAARPSKCGAHSERKVAHMAPRFQVPLRHVCCILFDAYHIHVYDVPERVFAS